MKQWDRRAKEKICFNKTKWNNTRNRNARLLNYSIKLVGNVIIVEEVGGKGCINFLLLL